LGLPGQCGPLDPLAVKLFQEVKIDVRWRDPMVGRDLLVGMAREIERRASSSV
jgi:hypothetical protein